MSIHETTPVVLTAEVRPEKCYCVTLVATFTEWPSKDDPMHYVEDMDEGFELTEEEGAAFEARARRRMKEKYP